MTYDEERGVVEAFDLKGHLVLRNVVTPTQQPFELDDDMFIWGSRELRVREDELGMAMRFVHHVNRRLPQTAHVRHLGSEMPGAQRWQYGIVNVGTFGTAERMQQTPAAAGANGWELVGVYDKATTWLGAGMEKGFMMLKRPVPDDVEPAQWCIAFNG